MEHASPALQIGSRSQNRTEVTRVRAEHFATKLNGINWSGCGVLPTDLRLPRPGLFLHELHPGVGAHERIRTSIFSSCYGYPVRSRARLHAHGTQGRDRTCDRLVNSQLLYRSATWVDWWSNGVTLPARRSCKDRLHPCACPVVLGRGFEPRSPALQAGAFTRLAFRAELVRTPVIETGPHEWRSRARPSSYIRGG